MNSFGLDLGMGACKLYGPLGCIEMPSQVAIWRDHARGLGGMRNARPPLKVELNTGQAFWVGLHAHQWGRPVENVDYDRLSGAPEMQAILYATLTQYVKEHGPIASPVGLYVGMPLEPLTGDGAAATLNAVRTWLTGVHRWQAGGEAYQVEVSAVKITSQATGALFDYLLDADGSFIPGRKTHIKKEIGIISIGFNTVELLVVQDNAPVQRFTAGSTNGVRRLLELLNTGGLYSLGELDTLLRMGSLATGEALTVWEREVSGQVERVWGTAWKRFATIISVGGGAMLLNGHLVRHFNGRVDMPDQPVMAVARGLHKLALLQGGRK
ncbi:MAG: ParM/StbA family protein [Candidatus Competibacter sp.]